MMQATVEMPTGAARKPYSEQTPNQWRAVPRELKERRQWVCWRYELNKKGKPTKVPYIPGMTSKAATNRHTTWRRYDEAVNCYQSRPDFFNGIGYVFAADDPYVGGDIDHSVEGGIISDDARQILPNTYAEISPSDTGIKWIARATGNYSSKTKRGEIYSSVRFFTITGNVIAGHETITNCQEQVDAFAAALGVNVDEAKRVGGSSKGERAELVEKYIDQIIAARKIASNPNELADRKRRLKHVARREGTQLAVLLSGDYAKFHELWPFVHLYRADGTLDESQVRAVLARRLYGYSFSFTDYVVLFCDHFNTHCRERYATKTALHEELCGLWENAIKKTNYTPKMRTSAECGAKRDVQQQCGGKGSGKGWRAGKRTKNIDRVYAAVEGYRAGAQAIIQIGALVDELRISRRTVSSCLDELRDTNRIATQRLAGGGGLVVTFNPTQRDVQQHNDVESPVLAVETPQNAVEQPVCIEVTTEEYLICVSSKEPMVDHISFEADHISPALTSIDEQVIDAFDVLAAHERITCGLIARYIKQAHGCEWPADELKAVVADEREKRKRQRMLDAIAGLSMRGLKAELRLADHKYEAARREESGASSFWYVYGAKLKAEMKTRPPEPTKANRRRKVYEKLPDLRHVGIQRDFDLLNLASENALPPQRTIFQAARIIDTELVMPSQPLAVHYDATGLIASLQARKSQQQAMNAQ